MLNALPQLETAITFFFGNGVPLKTACQFFIACNGHTYMHVKDQFQYLYEFWSQPYGNRWKRYYYNMREGKYLHIDGSYM